MAAVKIQHKSCLESTLRKKIINTLFAGLGRSVLGETVPSVLGTALGPQPAASDRTQSRPLAQFFPIRTSRPANNIYIYMYNCKMLYLIDFVPSPRDRELLHYMRNTFPRIFGYI